MIGRVKWVLDYLQTKLLLLMLRFCSYKQEYDFIHYSSAFDKFGIQTLLVFFKFVSTLYYQQFQLFQYSTHARPDLDLLNLGLARLLSLILIVSMLMQIEKAMC